MDVIQFLGTALGLSFVSGLRLYATVLALGLAIRLGWFYPTTGQEILVLVAEPAVMIVAGAAFLAEFVADKIPWLDSVWDAFHTFIRPIGATLLAAAALGTMDPAVKLACIVLCGGVALGSHSSKAAARVVLNQSPEPFTNIILSFVEDLLVPAGVWIALAYPFLTLTLVLFFVAGFVWLFPRVFRLLRIELVALRLWLAGGRAAASAVPATLPDAVRPAAREALGVIARCASALPEQYARAAVPAPAGREVGGIRCAAAKRVYGLRHSIGYLAVLDKELVFVTRRLFLDCVHRIGFHEIEGAAWSGGLLVNQLTLRMANGEETVFSVFKNVKIPRAGRAKGATS